MPDWHQPIYLIGRPSRKDKIMARSDKPQYTAADRYERRATRRQRPAEQTRRSAIRESLEVA